MIRQEPESLVRQVCGTGAKNEKGGCLAALLLFRNLSSELESLNVLSLPALGSLDHVELNLLAFLQ
jgi:hypothetical protein